MPIATGNVGEQDCDVDIPASGMNNPAFLGGRTLSVSLPNPAVPSSSLQKPPASPVSLSQMRVHTYIHDIPSTSHDLLPPCAVREVNVANQGTSFVPFAFHCCLS